MPILPTPGELRAKARLYRNAAKHASKSDDKRFLANCGLALAQIAEAIEGDGRIDALLEAPKLKNLLGYVDERVRNVVEQLMRQQKAEPIDTERIRAWRLRAEELRTAADNFSVPSAQDSLRRAAANYDRIADTAERSLGLRPPAPSDKAG